MNAGYVGYSTSATNDTRTVSVLSLYDNRVVVSRYDAQGEYTAAESLGQTNPKKPGEGEVANYPLTVPLLTQSEFTISAVSAAPAYGSVEVKGSYVRAVPNENYAVSSWTLTPADAATVTRDGDRFFLSDLRADCTLTVDFAETFCVSQQFADVDRSQWYHDGIDYAVSHGLFKGVASGRFDPEGTMTRAMLVTVLYRLDGAPAIAPDSGFSDVPENEWYAQAVTWGRLRGIVGGGRIVHDVIGKAPVQRSTFRVKLRQVGALADRTACGRQRIQRTLAPEDHAVLVQEGVVFLPRDAAAARGDHAAGALAQLCQNVGFHLTECRFALPGEEIRDLAAQTLHDLRVRIEKRAMQPCCE